MKKRILSLTLTLVLALSLAPAASAASTTPAQALSAFASFFSAGGDTRDMPDISRPILKSFLYVDFDNDGIPEVMRFFGANGESNYIISNKPIADVFYVEGSGDTLTVKRAAVFGADSSSGYDNFTLAKYANGTFGIVQTGVPAAEHDAIGNPIRNGQPIEDHYVFSGGTFSKTDKRPYDKITADGITNRYGLFTYKPTVMVSNQKLKVNGQEIKCEKYNIDGSNYFKLRDIAKLLNGTSSQFNVGWNAANNLVAITTGAAYVSNGSELSIEKDKSDSAAISTQNIVINGVTVSDLSTYNIGGNNFFKLRDLGSKLGFNVDWDAATSTVLVTSK